MAATLPDKRADGWDDASSEYARVVAPTTMLYAQDCAADAGLRAGERVLDVACGTGAFTAVASRAGAQVLATDFSSGMIAQLRARVAQEKLEGVEARVMDGQRLELPDASFDLAASIFGLIFFPDRIAGLREMRRVLRPGGRIALATWSVPSKVRVVSVVSEAVAQALPDLPPSREPPAIFSLSDPAVIDAELRKSGFSHVQQRRVIHTWRLPTPESVWTDLAPASPVFAAMLAALDPLSREKVRTTLLRRVRAEFGKGPVLLPGEAHIVVAR